jgi:hypothetical protein
LSRAVSGPGPPLPKQPITVDDHVQQQYAESERDLESAGEPGRVDDCRDVVSDEIALVAAPAAELTERRFQRCQRAEHAEKFDQRPPDDGRQMQPHESGPPQHEKAAQNHENDKGQVDDQDQIGGKTVEHCYETSRLTGVGRIDGLGFISWESTSPCLYF